MKIENKDDQVVLSMTVKEYSVLGCVYGMGMDKMKNEGLKHVDSAREEMIPLLLAFSAEANEIFNLLHDSVTQIMRTDIEDSQREGKAAEMASLFGMGEDT